VCSEQRTDEHMRFYCIRAIFIAERIVVTTNFAFVLPPSIRVRIVWFGTIPATAGIISLSYVNELYGRVWINGNTVRLASGLHLSVNAERKQMIFRFVPSRPSKFNAVNRKIMHYLSTYQPGGHYATSRKVAGLIPDEVIGFFSWFNPSSRTMDLGSIQPLTEMCQKSSWG
jgi:hypothetical protein